MLRKTEITKRLEEIAKRSEELSNQLETRDAEVDVETITSIENEVSQLEEEKTSLTEELAEIETKEQEASDIEDGKEPSEHIETEHKEERKMFELNTREYRNAWLNNLRGIELKAEERDAIAVLNGAIPTETVNDVMTVIRSHAPLLARATVIDTPANLTYFVEGTVDAATIHTAGAAITPSEDTLIPVSLVPAEVTKLIKISEGAKAMSIDAFEAWVAKNLGESIAKKLNGLMLTEMGNVTAAASTITAANIQLLLGSVEGANLLVCNRKTLYTKLLPLQDNSKTPIIKFDGGDAYCYGVKVELDSQVADDVIQTAAMEKLVVALAEDVTVRSAYDIDSNSYKYIGVALFDCKRAYDAAFGKISA